MEAYEFINQQLKIIEESQYPNFWKQLIDVNKNNYVKYEIFEGNDQY